ncbi:hypothetical protein M0811_01296 [Anaeramoeba ignava]|uniref:SGF29 C-terminal domain-containing protein n=1 Tax=Anaeramoeba ignava TaxID=1746090 RepID=A0A9Q0R9N3_ANAIG|nr:hypothetical protein M0811_01296 [Anaeramoeba ignava]|eukprot:Anaeramoba_ignava/a483725_15.p1 GENE.a483725_15~~a483725_15.p1  ORF type:complete len:236 (+),score=70.13 a483725_15:19-726(+)
MEEKKTLFQVSMKRLDSMIKSYDFLQDRSANSLLNPTINELENKEQRISQILNQLDSCIKENDQILETLRSLDWSGQLPKYTGKLPIPPLCGAIPFPPDQEIPPNYLVAVKTQETDEPILCYVKKKTDQGAYEVVDADEVNEPRIFLVTRDQLVPLPRWYPILDVRETEFPVKSKVRAIYPETTAFYSAEVIAPPSGRTTPNPPNPYDYKLIFEGETAIHTVNARHVVDEKFFKN